MIPDTNHVNKMVKINVRFELITLPIDKILFNRLNAMTAIVQLETYTTIAWTNGTKKHNTCPNGQWSSSNLATLKGMLNTVIKRSDVASDPINRLVVVWCLKQTRTTNAFPMNDIITINKYGIMMSTFVIR